MTQQLDLTLSITNTLDNMANNTYSKDKASYDSGNFGNYLDNANKSYLSGEKTDKNLKEKSDKSFNEKKAGFHSEAKNDKNTVSNDSKQNFIDKKNDYKDSESVSEKKSSKKGLSTVKDSSKEVEAKDEQVALKEVEISQNNLLIEKAEITVAEDMTLDNSLILNIDEVSSDVVELNNNLKDFINEIKENEIPVDAIKSGIDLKSVSNILDLSEVSEPTVMEETFVETAIEDIVVPKEEAISAMYNIKSLDKTLKTENSEEIVNVRVVEDKNEKISLPNENVKVLEESNDIVKNKNLEDVDIQEVKVLSEDKNMDLSKNISNEFVKNEKPVEAEVVSKVETNEDKDNTKINDKQLTKTEDDKTLQNQSLALNKVGEASLQEVKNINMNEFVTTQEKSEKTEVVQKDKLSELQQEIQTAKEENSFETLSTDTKNKAEKEKVSDNFAKTNVKAEETIQIKDDVKDIEFVASKVEKDISSKKIKKDEQIENVKIQVEEDVEITPVQQNNNAEKVAKANETMNKSGLTTKTLNAMDGKISELNSGSQQKSAGFDGETSQEMLMRDLLQESTENVSNSQSDTKVDFTQALNKVSGSQSPQTAQQAQEPQEIDIINQIRAKFAVNSAKGMQKITIGLTPESLGKLVIEIAKGENGLSANILTDNAQAKELLDKNLDGLKNALQSQGVSVNNVNVKVAEAGRSSDSDNNMYRENEAQFDSNGKGGNSKNSEDTNKEKRSEYEFNQSNVASQEIEMGNDVAVQTQQTEKIVSIKGGLGNIKYKV